MRLLLLVALILIGVLAARAQSLPAACMKDQTSHTSKVIKEKVLCLNNGNCTQEVYFTHGGYQRVLTNTQKPWVAPDEEITVLRIVTRTALIARYSSGSGQTYYYKLAIYCDDGVSDSTPAL